MKIVVAFHLGMTHKETVDFVANNFGVSVDPQNFYPPKKTMFQTQINTPKEILLIIDALHNFSHTKHKQMELFKDFVSLQESIPYKSRLEQKEAYLKMVDMYIELRKLNERGKRPDYEAMRNLLIRKVLQEFGDV
jgi:hypothetical protein